MVLGSSYLSARKILALGTAELDYRDRTNTQGLKTLRNEGTVYAMQTARPSSGSDGHEKWRFCLKQET